MLLFCLVNNINKNVAKVSVVDNDKFIEIEFFFIRFEIDIKKGEGH